MFARMSYFILGGGTLGAVVVIMNSLIKSSIREYQENLCYTELEAKGIRALKTSHNNAIEVDISDSGLQYIH